MIDQILSRKTSPGENEALEDYTPNQAITNTRLVNEESATLTVVFPPWHGAGEVMKKLERKIVAQGTALLTFDLHDHVLEPNTEGVVKSYKYLQETISGQINNLHEKHNYKEIHLVSISLGIVPLMMVSRRLKFFSRATLVLAGNSFASCLWDGIRTQKMRQAFMEQGYDLSKLKLAWAELEPDYDVTVMKNKDVHMYISETDEITPLKYAEALRRKLSDAGAHIGDSRWRVGHAMSIIRFCLLPPGRLKTK